MTKNGSEGSDAPRPGVKRILQILVETRDQLGPPFDDEIYFLGSITKVQSGLRTWSSVGDVDILVGGEHMAERFWELLGSLVRRGIRSVWDVCEVPQDILDVWKPCHARREHPLSLTLDCEANLRTFESHEFKQFNLDIKLDPLIVPKVPMSSRWMYGNSSNLRCDDSRVAALHGRFLQSDMLYSSSRAVKFGNLLPSIKILI